MNWKKNLPLVVFCLYLIKTVLQPATFVEASILFALAAMSCYFEFKSNDNKLSELEQKINQTQKNIDSKAAEVENLKSSVAALKLSSGMRSLGNVPTSR